MRVVVLVTVEKVYGVKNPVEAGRDLYIAQAIYYGCTFSPSRTFLIPSLPSSLFFFCPFLEKSPSTVVDYYGH